jgi:hypothetical protein
MYGEEEQHFIRSLGRKELHLKLVEIHELPCPKDTVL